MDCSYQHLEQMSTLDHDEVLDILGLNSTFESMEISSRDFSHFSEHETVANRQRVNKFESLQATLNIPLASTMNNGELAQQLDTINLEQVDTFAYDPQQLQHVIDADEEDLIYDFDRSEEKNNLNELNVHQIIPLSQIEPDVGSDRRRNSRRRIAPVEYWNGVTVQYDDDGTLLGVQYINE